MTLLAFQVQRRTFRSTIRLPSYIKFLASSFCRLRCSLRFLARPFLHFSFWAKTLSFIKRPLYRVLDTIFTITFYSIIKISIKLLKGPKQQTQRWVSRASRVSLSRTHSYSLCDVASFPDFVSQIWNLLESFLLKLRSWNITTLNSILILRDCNWI